MVEPMSGDGVPREAVASHVYAVTVYAVAVGALYLWGYWSQFEFNVLEYFSLIDIVRYTAYPLATAFAGLIVTHLWAEVVMGRGVDTSAQRAADLLSARVSRRTATQVARVIFVVALVAAMYWGGPYKWLLAGGIFSMPFSLRLTLSGLLPRLSGRYRSTFFSVVCFMAFTAFGYGHLTASKVLEGERFRYPVSAIEGLPQPPGAGVMEVPRLIGHAGDHYFFLVPEDLVVAIVPAANVGTLRLRVYDRPSESEPAQRTPPALPPRAPRLLDEPTGEGLGDACAALGCSWRKGFLISP